MASNPNSRAGSMKSEEKLFSGPSLGYVDDFLSAFDRPKKVHVYKRPTEKTVSTENLLRKPPLLRTKPLQSLGNVWSSGFLRRFPYSGALALLAVLLCSAGDWFILWKSDGQEVSSWTISPSVYLSVFSATANVCLEYAHGQGIIVAWWRKALQGGTLNDLNEYWEFGDSILAAGLSGRKFNFVAFATLMAAAIVINGPLLQVASTITTKEITKAVNVTALIAEELPYGYTGSGNIMSDSSGSEIIMVESFVEIANAYANHAPITTNFTGCIGTCSGVVRAAGLAVNCTESSTPWTSSREDTASRLDVPVFSSDFGFMPAFNRIWGNYPNDTNPFTNPFLDSPFIDFRLSYATGRASGLEVADGYESSLFGESGARQGCNGTLVTKRCSMRSATLDYPVTLINNTLSLARGSINFAIDHIQAVGEPYVNRSRPDLNPISYTTLGGVVKAARNMFTSRAQTGLSGAYVSSLEGSVASQYVDYGKGNRSFFKTQDACSINWSDPTFDIVDALNEMMFRAALRAKDVSKYSVMNSSDFDWWTSYYEMFPVTYTSLESGIPAPQTISMLQTSQITIFRSHYEYLAGALVVMFLGVLVLMPLFYSFWSFGREVSLNPLEIAKAFNAELLREQGSNSTLKHLTKSFGEKEVKYGEIVDNAEETDWKGGRNGSRRLELADPSRVREPQFQMVYI